jgi:hypothetical protein
MTAKGPPSRASHYVAGVTAPLAALVQAPGAQRLPAALRQVWGGRKACITRAARLGCRDTAPPRACTPQPRPCLRPARRLRPPPATGAAAGAVPGGGVRALRLAGGGAAGGRAQDGEQP